MTEELRHKLSVANTGTKWSAERRAAFERKRAERDEAAGHLPLPFQASERGTAS